MNTFTTANIGETKKPSKSKLKSPRLRWHNSYGKASIVSIKVNYVIIQFKSMYLLSVLCAQPEDAYSTLNAFNVE